MAITSITTTASPQEVWSVLCDGWMYSNWVVGTSHMRAVEDAWPAKGSKLYHASGIWPTVRRDETEVVEVEPGLRLVLLAKARPLAVARVVIALDSDRAGTRITMTESPVSGPAKWLHNPAAEFVLTQRNNEALARLAAIAERRQQPADQADGRPRT